MLRSAEALLSTRGFQPGRKPEAIVQDFQAQFVEPGLFWEPRFEYLPKWLTRDAEEAMDEEHAHLAIEEGTLFVEQAHEVFSGMQVREAERRERPKRRTKPEPKKEEPAVSEVEEIVDRLDLSGVECPFNYVQTKLRLETMEPGQLLEITIDDGEPIRNVPRSLQNDGHEIVDIKKIGNQFRLLIRKGER